MQRTPSSGKSGQVAMLRFSVAFLTFINCRIGIEIFLLGRKGLTPSAKAIFVDEPQIARQVAKEPKNSRSAACRSRSGQVPRSSCKISLNHECCGHISGRASFHIEFCDRQASTLNYMACPSTSTICNVALLSRCTTCSVVQQKIAH